MEVSAKKVLKVYLFQHLNCQHAADSIRKVQDDEPV